MSRHLYLMLLLCVTVSSLCAAPRPNIIIVMTDDQGYGEFAFSGNPLAKTPSLDKLASQSIRLTDFHVAPYVRLRAVSCSPAWMPFAMGQSTSVAAGSCSGLN